MSNTKFVNIGVLEMFVGSFLASFYLHTQSRGGQVLVAWGVLTFLIGLVRIIYVSVRES